MYGNEGQHVNSSRKDPKTEIGDGSSRGPLCWKPQGSEIPEDFEETRRIIHEAADKKGSGRFVRGGPAGSSSIKEESPKLKNKGELLVHYKGGSLLGMFNTMAEADSSFFSKKQMNTQEPRPPILKRDQKLYHINSPEAKSWPKMDDRIMWHKNYAYRHLKEPDEAKQGASPPIKKIERAKPKKLIEKVHESIEIKGKEQPQQDESQSSTPLPTEEKSISDKRPFKKNGQIKNGKKDKHSVKKKKSVETVEAIQSKNILDT